MSGRILNADRDFKKRAVMWWTDVFKSKSRLDAVTISGDGWFRFHWDDGQDSGTYLRKIEEVLNATASITHPQAD